MSSESNSKIFTGYRTLGVNSDHVPSVIRYNQKHHETYVITSVGRAFHVYKCSNMGLIRVSDSLKDEISCLGVDSTFIYASAKKNVYAFRFGRKIAHVYSGHEADVHQLLPFGAHLISVDEDNVVKIWNIETAELYLNLNFGKETFDITTMLHPVTYLNKILFGSKQGTMQLWNIKTSKNIYSFASFQSPITIIRQAPAIDVVGVGLENGRIILHNLKYDETIVSFIQEWGSVRSLTFRTDGIPIMISGSFLGHMAIWNLEENKLVAQLREAHTGSVSALNALQLEPLMVSSSSDNSIKVWLFDMSDGSARLLRQRHGHSLPPALIRFHDHTSILSAGMDSCLMAFSTDHDHKNKSLGRASFNKLETKRSGLRLDQHKMPPIVMFSSSEAKQSEWDNVVCVHENTRVSTTWDYVKSSMGKYKLDHERFRENEKLYASVTATCCTISNCGNYCLIGYSSGHVDLYNIQSGLFRGTYGKPYAHACSVRGVATDALNLTTITCGENGEISFWPFKNKLTLKSLVINAKSQLRLECNRTIDRIQLHRENGLLAVSTDDFSVYIVDCDINKVVRKFSGHSNKISDMAFSSDSRWLITASMDCMIKVWDIPTGKLIDCFKFASAPTSVCFSPTSEFLATTHVNELGIYLWSNKTLFAHVPFKQLPDDFEPLESVQMPNTSSISSPGTAEPNSSESAATEEGDDLDDYQSYTSPEQLALELITLSLLPESRWKSLVNLDLIKKRNKPKEAPKAPTLAPFFLPTVANEQGFKFKTISDAKDANKQSKTGGLGKDFSQFASVFLSDFATKLSKANQDLDYDELLKEMKNMGPSAIDLEIRLLGSDMNDSVELLERFLQFIIYLLSSKNNFELANSYLSLTLKIHSDTISMNESLVAIMETIKDVQIQSWNNLEFNLNQNICLVSYLKNVT